LTTEAPAPDDFGESHAPFLQPISGINTYELQSR
jgi:hypothetical protein